MKITVVIPPTPASDKELRFLVPWKHDGAVSSLLVEVRRRASRSPGGSEALAALIRGLSLGDLGSLDEQDYVHDLLYDGAVVSSFAS